MWDYAFCTSITIICTDPFTGSTVQFAKQYARHRVLYEGAVKGVQMMGRWRLESSPSIKGEWAMWPVGGGR